MIPYRKEFLFREHNTNFYSVRAGNQDPEASPVTERFANWCIRNRNMELRIYDEEEYEARVKESLGE